MQAIVILTGLGVLASVQTDAVIEQAHTQTQKLNHYLCSKARYSNDLNYLASPVTGGGIVVPRFLQLFLLARSEGLSQTQDLARFVWQILSANGQLIVKSGTTLQSEADNMAELSEQATLFIQQQLPILQAVGIA